MDSETIAHEHRCFILDSSILPAIPKVVIDYFNEPLDSFVHFFFHLYLMEDPDVVKRSMIDALSESVQIEGGGVDATLFDPYINELYRRYQEFESKASRVLAFMTDIPDHLYVNDVEVNIRDNESVALTLIFGHHNEYNAHANIPTRILDSTDWRISI